MDEILEKSRISKIHIGRVFNLGNYENIRYEITIDIGSNDSPSDVLINAERILNNLYAKSETSEYILQNARDILAKPSSELTDRDIQRIPEYRELIAKHDSVKERRKAARIALDTLCFSSEYKDAKLDWEDDNDY